MAHYLWKGISVQGYPMEGGVESSNVKEVVASLRKQNIFEVRFQQVFARKLRVPLSQELLVHFLNQLHRLLESGVELVDCLSFIIRQRTHPAFRYILCRLRQDIQEGKSLTESFQRFASCFPSIFIHLIAVAEKSGNLQEVLKELSDFFVFQNKFAQERRKLLVYPWVVSGGAFVLFLGILLFIVPTFKTMFLASPNALPLTTKGMILLSDSLREAPEYWVLAAAGMGGLVAYVSRWVDWRRGLAFIPLLRGMEKSTRLLFYARSMTIMLQAGVKLREALKLSETLFPKFLQKELRAVHQQIDFGNSLVDAYSRSALFPALFVHLVAVGESSGYLAPTFERIALLYQETLERRMNFLNSLVEPIFTLLLAIGILIVLLSIYLPIFDLAGQF